MSLQFYADGKDGVFDSTFLNHEPTTIAAGHGGSTAKPSSRESETAAEASIASSAESRIISGQTNLVYFRNRAELKTTTMDNNFTRSVIISRPLYLHLLTNVTPVLAPLLFNNHRGFEGAVEAENKIPSTGGSGTDWTGQAGDALEVAPEGT
ncbi:hypothetical protein OIU78_001982 [Salix suchowensis]|nr:hypothetical protein OIU78_001982 [Salix suchowensis]